MRRYLYVGFLVVVAWIVTWFVPELPLRTTNAPSVADAAIRSEPTFGMKRHQA